jgi:hypothetical protein
MFIWKILIKITKLKKAARLFTAGQPQQNPTQTVQAQVKTDLPVPLRT